MSSKKTYMTVGLADELAERLRKEADAEQRSRGFIIERMLRDRYKLPRKKIEEIAKGES